VEPNLVVFDEHPAGIPRRNVDKHKHHPAREWESVVTTQAQRTGPGPWLQDVIEANWLHMSPSFSHARHSNR